MMDYGQEAELICRALVDRGVTLSHTHYSMDRNEYRHDCEGLAFSRIAYHLWNTEDSLLHIEYEGQQTWLRFIFGNSWGELVGDWGMAGDPLNTIIDDIILWNGGDGYTSWNFTELTRLMGGPEVYTSTRTAAAANGDSASTKGEEE